jgi:hypothetical protein
LCCVRASPALFFVFFLKKIQTQSPSPSCCAPVKPLASRSSLHSTTAGCRCLYPCAFLVAPICRARAACPLILYSSHRV